MIWTLKTPPLTISDVLEARSRIASEIYLSPCPESIPISELCGAEIYCKLDYLQRTGSFKERGARNALMLLSDEQRSKGVIAASAGNHALGLAYHGSLLDAPVTVVMPKFAPLIKRATCARLGGRVILHGETFAAAREKADEIAKAEGLTYIHGFDDPAIIAGQGTVALEVLEQVPDVQAILVPVGGGGLVAGVSLVVKSMRPDVQVIGVEPANAASFTNALSQGGPASCDLQPTLADGLAVGKLGANAFEIAASRVDRVVTVNEDMLSLAVLRLVELEKSVVEGAGAAPLAAFLEGKLADLAGKRVVMLLSGGNIDPTLLNRVIDRGLVTDGRLVRFSALITDRPGGLAALTRLIADAGASIEEISHDRAFSGPDVTSARVLCTIQTSDAAHAKNVIQTVRDAGVIVTVAGNGG